MAQVHKLQPQKTTEITEATREPRGFFEVTLHVYEDKFFGFLEGQSGVDGIILMDVVPFSF